MMTATIIGCALKRAQEEKSWGSAERQAKRSPVKGAWEIVAAGPCCSREKTDTHSTATFECASALLTAGLASAPPVQVSAYIVWFLLFVLFGCVIFPSSMSSHQCCQQRRRTTKQSRRHFTIWKMIWMGKNDKRAEVPLQARPNLFISPFSVLFHVALVTRYLVNWRSSSFQKTLPYITTARKTRLALL